MATRFITGSVFCSAAVLLGISRATFGLGDNTDRPPPLTFDKHVDYLGWYDELVSKGKSNNALELYLKLSAEGKDGFHGPPTDIEAQFNEAMKRPWDAGEFPDLKHYLDHNESQFRLFKSATERKHFWQVRDPKSRTLLDAIFLPSLGPSRTICKSLVVQGWMHDDHQAEKMFANWQTIFASAWQFSQQPILLCQMVSTVERDLVFHQARLAAYAGIFDEMNVSRAISILRECAPGMPRLDDSVVIEWGFALDVLQSICKSGKLDLKQWKSFCRTVDTWPPSMNKEVGRPIDPKETLDGIERYFSKLKSDVQIQPHRKQLQALKQLHEEFTLPKQQNAFLKVMLADYSRACELMMRSEVQRRGTMLVLALHEHKYKSKKWPDKLDSLTLVDLESLRIDPYSDKDFIYKVTPDGPLLYSIAADGKDNKGRHDPKWGESEGGGDYVFWPVQDTPSVTSKPRGE